jgi:glucose-6-phosphate 1-dehydrogenase
MFIGFPDKFAKPAFYAGLVSLDFTGDNRRGAPNVQISAVIATQLRKACITQVQPRAGQGSGVIDGKPVPGFRQEPGVNPNSTTETYAAVKFQIENWRWAGVPFYIRTGKHLARNLTEIRIHLKPTPQTLFASTSSSIDPNVITISIQPDEGISIAFDAKRPGTQVRTVTVQANFSYQGSFGSKGPVAYETLLLDSMRGDATLFTRRDEVEAEWRIITPIEEAWAQLPAPDFPNYVAGSEGPTSWHELLESRANAPPQAIGHRE